MSTRNCSYRLEVAPHVSITLDMIESGEYEGLGMVVEDSLVTGATLHAYGRTVDLLEGKDRYMDNASWLDSCGIDAFEVVSKGADVTRERRAAA